MLNFLDKSGYYLGFFRDVIEADEIKLDRWTVAFKFELERRDDMRLELANRTNTVDTNEESSQVLVGRLGSVKMSDFQEYFFSIYI